MLKAIFCDFDDTLWGLRRKVYEKILHTVYKRVYKRFPREVSLQEFLDAYHMAKKRVYLDALAKTNALYFQFMVEDMFDTFDASLLGICMKCLLKV